jgi:DNA-directed RNA polymerase sigma subunit (sigma70/sigma32)
MRRSGYTLQKIGDSVGVSRERVRQILKELVTYPFPVPATKKLRLGLTMSTSQRYAFTAG